MSEKTLVEQLWEIPSCVELGKQLGLNNGDAASCALTRSAIADRIEAGYTPNSVVESDYIPAPRDADGVPCKIGDEVDCEDGPFTVDGIKMWCGGWWVFHENGLQCGVEWCHHVKPDTPESIASDIDNGRCTGQQAVERFKALGGAEW